jgi:hypothetical protein
MPDTETAPETEVDSGPSFEDRAAGFEATSMEPELIKPKAAPAKKPAEEKAAPAKEVPKEAPKAEEKKLEPEKPKEESAKPAEKAEAAPAKPRPWEMYHKAKTELDTVAKERDTLKAELESTRKNTPQVDPFEHPEVKKIKARAQELEDHIKFVDYTKSDEFLTKHEKPYTELTKRLMADATDMMVENPADGTVRALTQQEAWSVVSAPIKEDAYKIAGRCSQTIRPRCPNSWTAGRRLPRRGARARRPSMSSKPRVLSVSSSSLKRARGPIIRSSKRRFSAPRSSTSLPRRRAIRRA